MAPATAAATSPIKRVTRARAAAKKAAPEPAQPLTSDETASTMMKPATKKRAAPPKRTTTTATTKSAAGRKRKEEELNEHKLTDDNNAVATDETRDEPVRKSARRVAGAKSVAPTAPSAAPMRKIKVTPLSNNTTEEHATRTASAVATHDTVAQKITEQAKETRTREIPAKKPQASKAKKANAANNQKERAKPKRQAGQESKKTSKGAVTKTRTRQKKVAHISEQKVAAVEAALSEDDQKNDDADDAANCHHKNNNAQSEHKTAPRATSTRSMAKVPSRGKGATSTRANAAAASKLPPKKVAFHGVPECDKENHEPALTAPAKGLRAKPVRRPAAPASARAKTKEVPVVRGQMEKEVANDDVEVASEMIEKGQEVTTSSRRDSQRVLTPKKVTQVAKATSPAVLRTATNSNNVSPNNVRHGGNNNQYDDDDDDDDDDDELSGAKTPIRDLSQSPKRSNHFSNRTLSPLGKKLDFGAPPLVISPIKKSSSSLMSSPARRPVQSSGKGDFTEPRAMLNHVLPMATSKSALPSTLSSPARRPAQRLEKKSDIFSGSQGTIPPPAIMSSSSMLASPARRPTQSPSRDLCSQSKDSVASSTSRQPTLSTLSSPPRRPTQTPHKDADKAVGNLSKTPALPAPVELKSTALSFTTDSIPSAEEGSVNGSSDVLSTPVVLSQWAAPASIPTEKAVSNAESEHVHNSPSLIQPPATDLISTSVVLSPAECVTGNAGGNDIDEMADLISPSAILPHQSSNITSSVNDTLQRIAPDVFSACPALDPSATSNQATIDAEPDLVMSDSANGSLESPDDDEFMHGDPNVPFHDDFVEGFPANTMASNEIPHEHADSDLTDIQPAPTMGSLQEVQETAVGPATMAMSSSGAFSPLLSPTTDIVSEMRSLPVHQLDDSFIPDGDLMVRPTPDRSSFRVDDFGDSTLDAIDVDMKDWNLPPVTPTASAAATTSVHESPARIAITTTTTKVPTKISPDHTTPTPQAEGSPIRKPPRTPKSQTPTAGRTAALKIDHGMMSAQRQGEHLPTAAQKEELVDRGSMQTPAIHGIQAQTPITAPTSAEIDQMQAETPKALLHKPTPKTQTPTTAKAPARATLQGAVVYVDVHTTEGADASSIFTDLLTHLGAKCVKTWSWNPRAGMKATGAQHGNLMDGDGVSKVGITHVVYKDGGVRTLEKVRDTDGLVKCVGVGWILDCERENKWIDESIYAVDMSTLPRGGSRRRKSMEPRTLVNVNGNISKARALSSSLPQAGGRRSFSAEMTHEMKKELIQTPIRGRAVSSEPELEQQQQQQQQQQSEENEDEATGAEWLMDESGFTTPTNLSMSPPWQPSQMPFSPAAAGDGPTLQPPLTTPPRFVAYDVADPALQTPAPQQFANGSIMNTAPPQLHEDMQPEKQQLVQMTCPPKQTMKGLFSQQDAMGAKLRDDNDLVGRRDVGSKYDNIRKKNSDNENDNDDENANAENHDDGSDAGWCMEKTTLQKRLDQVRRTTLGWKPAVGSPLGKF